VTVPPRRPDITTEVDLIEEIVRLNGFDKVPEKAPVSTLTAQNRNEALERTRRAKQILVGLGFHETVHLPFAPRDEAGKLKLAEGDARGRAVPVANPLADDQAVLRATLLPVLLSNLTRQRAQKNGDVRLFELRSVFQWKKTGELPDEPRRLTGLLSGRRDPAGWGRASDLVDFHDAKGAVEALVAALTRKPLQFAAANEPFLVAGAQAAMTFVGKPLGICGEVHPEVLEAFGTSGARAFVFDLDFELLSREAGGVPEFAELPRFPAVDRDVALVVDESTEVGAMLSFARITAKKGLESVDVFDVFRGGRLGAGKKSVALGMIWRSSEKTLTDEEVNAMHEKLVAALEQKFNATRRT
jgi:phenylalanyl-tRNA synthetase beta chain